MLFYNRIIKIIVIHVLKYWHSEMRFMILTFWVEYTFKKDTASSFRQFGFVLLGIHLAYNQIFNALKLSAYLPTTYKMTCVV